ncbi:MAG TPA: hypothetical protein VE709_07135, partial [Pseudonocardiaceae bacterium]|nr:hypothetical protein [Pseudonocardiaceae bacterium]
AEDQSGGPGFGCRSSLRRSGGGMKRCGSSRAGSIKGATTPPWGGSHDPGDRASCWSDLNSWGRNYPHRTWMPDEVLDRLMQEEGEIAIPTDR